MFERRLRKLPWIEMLESRHLLSAAVAAGLLDIPSTMPLKQSEYSKPVAAVGAKVIFGDAGNGSDLYFNPDPAAPPNTYDFAVVYDLATGLWTTTQRPHILGAATATVGQKAIFAGGDFTTQISSTPGRNDVDIYNDATGNWSTAQLSSARLYISTVTVGNKAIFAGGAGGVGAGGFGNADPAVDIYDDATGQWSTGVLSVARFSIDAVAVGGEAIFAGGITSNFKPLGAVDLYDPFSGQWSTAALSVVRSGFTSAVVGDKAIFAGGNASGFPEFPASDAPSAAVDLYDATTGRWSTAELSQRRESIATATVGSLAFFAGGDYRDHNNTSHASSVVDIYNDANGRWTTSQLPVPLESGNAVTIGRRAVFIGSKNQRDQKGFMEVYNADTGRWSVAELPSDPGLIVPVGGKLLITQRQDYQPTPPFLADLLAFTDAAPPSNQFPADSSSGASPAVYRWSPVTGAASYDVYLDGTLAANLKTTRWTTPTPALTVGLHTWQVVAHVDGGLVRGLTTNFTVEGLKVSASLRSLNFSLIPNATGTATLTVGIANITNASGAIVVGLFASPTGAFDGSAIPLGVTTLPFSPSQQATLPVNVPRALQPGVQYHLLLTVRFRRTTKAITFGRRTFVLGIVQGSLATGAATASGLL